MKKLLALLAVAALVAGCAAKKPAEAFKPTDDADQQYQGGKGEVGDGSEVDFGLDMELDDEPADGEAKSFHPTDALLIGGNGGFNPTNDDESVINFDQNE